MNIPIQEIIRSDTALDSEQGKAVRDFYGVSWKQHDLVFDFAGVIRVLPSFLSQSLLPLLFELSPDGLAQKVAFMNPPPALDYAWENILKAVAARVHKSANGSE